MDEGLIRLIGVLLFSTFMPLTAVSYFTARRRKKDIEFDEILGKLGVKRNDVEFLVPRLDEQFARHDYIVPLLFVVVVCALGSAMLLFGAEENWAGKENFLFGIPDW